jgi:hypothetical protein
LFIDNLHNILQEIYILASKVKFSGEYIESLPPAERRLQLSYYEREIAEQNKQSKKSSSRSISMADLVGNDD